MHQNVIRSRLNGEMPTWSEYVSAMRIRFGSDLHYDPMVELKNLKQLGLVQTYLDKFDELLNKIFLLEEYTMSYFLSGLKD